MYVKDAHPYVHHEGRLWPERFSSHCFCLHSLLLIFLRTVKFTWWLYSLNVGPSPGLCSDLCPSLFRLRCPHWHVTLTNWPCLSTIRRSALTNLSGMMQAVSWSPALHFGARWLNLRIGWKQTSRMIRSMSWNTAWSNALSGLCAGMSAWAQLGWSLWVDIPCASPPFINEKNNESIADPIAASVDFMWYDNHRACIAYRAAWWCAIGLNQSLLNSPPALVHIGRTCPVCHMQFWCSHHATIHARSILLSVRVHSYSMLHTSTYWKPTSRSEFIRTHQLHHLSLCGPR